MATLEEFINELIGKELLTTDEKDIILGNDAKGIEAKYLNYIRPILIEYKRLGIYLKFFPQYGQNFSPPSRGEPQPGQVGTLT